MAKAARDAASATASAVKVTSYDKWNDLECSDEESEEQVHVVTFSDPKDAAKFNAVMLNLSAWLTVAEPAMDHAEMVHLVRFVATQHGGNGANNTHLHQQIVAAMAMQNAADSEPPRTAAQQIAREQLVESSDDENTLLGHLQLFHAGNVRPSPPHCLTLE